MSSRFRILLAFITIAISILACAVLEKGSEKVESGKAEEPHVTETPSLELPSDTPEAASCPAITDKIVELNSTSLDTEGSSSSAFGARDEESEINLVTYTVSGNEISAPQYNQVSADLQEVQNDANKHRQLWDYFAALIPLENRKNLVEFSIMTDGSDNILASVSQTSEDPNQWELNVDFTDTQDYYNFSFTLVHEFAHLLTLGPGQVPPSEAVFNNPDDNDIYLAEVSACPNFFPGEGCANSDAYINTFYDQFWADKYDEWNRINLEENDDAYYQLLDDFYYKYQDEFLTDYAATNPAEDIAESFAFFVFSKESARDGIAGEKILFFHNYPELVDLRAHILKNLCAFFPK